MAVTAIFPSLAGLAFPVNKTPVWSTLVHRAVSGKKTTQGLFSYPFYQFELSFGTGDGGFLRSSTVYREYQELFAFFNSVGGARDLFRYNTTDNTVTQQSFGTPDSTTTQFQLTVTTTGTVSSWTDPVWASTVSAILIDGSSISSTAYTMGDTGLVTMSTVLSSTQTLAWSSTGWWYLCRFDDDTATFETFMKNLVEQRRCNFSSEKF